MLLSEIESLHQETPKEVKMEKEFTFNGRYFTAKLTKSGGVEVWYGIIKLPSQASNEIFIEARRVLGLPPCDLFDFFK